MKCFYNDPAPDPESSGMPRDMRDCRSLWQRFVMIFQGYNPLPWYWCIIFLACLSLGNARAHDLPTDWIGQERRTNAQKQLCCGEGDCHPFTVDQVKVMPDGYHFPDGEVVPFDKVAPSIDNLYWICRWGGETKCTFAPLGAS